MAEYSDYIETRIPAGTLTGDEIFGISQGGAARKLTLDDIADYVGAGGGTTFEFDRAWSSELLFDKNDIYYADHTQTGAINFTIAAAGNLVDGSSTIVQRITSDGTNTISFTGFDPDFIKGITSGDVLPIGNYEFWFAYRNGEVSVSVPGNDEGGTITSVNGQTGPVVTLDAGDVGADPAGTAAALLTTSITNGDTTHAPDGNAVFNALALKADLASPVFTGNPTAPTPSVGDNDTSIATTAFVTAATVGVQDMFVPATAMWPRATGGCADLTKSEMATSIVNIQTLDFDQTTQEFAQFQIVFPRKWNIGTVTAEAYWTAAAGTGTVQFGLSGGAYSNDDALTVALGTAQTMDDTLLAANDLHITPTSSAITLAGTPANTDFLVFQLSRNPASDTLTADAKFLGIMIHITTTKAIDS